MIKRRRPFAAAAASAVMVLMSIGLGSATSARALPMPGRELTHPATSAGGAADEAEVAGSRALAVSASGSKLIGGNFAVSVEPIDEVRPAAAYNSTRNEYLVAWHNDRAGNDDIYAQRVSKDGVLVGNWLSVAAGTGVDRRTPHVAYDSASNQYLVVWEHISASAWGIRGQRVSATGQLTGGEITIADTNLVTSDYKEPAVAYASSEDKFLVVYWASTILGERILASALEPDGTPSGSEFEIVPISANLVSHPDLAYNHARNEYLVVWQQKPILTGSYDIYGIRVKMSGGAGVLGGSFAIFVYGNEETSPAVAAIPEPVGMGQYLVVCEITVGGQQWIEGKRVTGTGVKEASRIYVSTVSRDATNPSVAGSESANSYLVAWTHDYPSPADTGIRGRAISPGGDLLGEETVVGGSAADHADVESGYLGEFLVAFDDIIPFATADIYGQLWGTRVHLPLVLK